MGIDGEHWKLVINGQIVAFPRFGLISTLGAHQHNAMRHAMELHCLFTKRMQLL